MASINTTNSLSIHKVELLASLKVLKELPNWYLNNIDLWSIIIFNKFIYATNWFAFAIFVIGFLYFHLHSIFSTNKIELLKIRYTWQGRGIPKKISRRRGEGSFTLAVRNEARHSRIGRQCQWITAAPSETFACSLTS